MSHSRAIIDLVLSVVSDTYPADGGFKAVIEKRLLGQKRNVQPDIQILEAGGRVVCVVEIGYTRPEKLTYYREVVGIRDVRWYDKSGVLHASVTGHTTIEYVDKVTREVPDPSDCFCVVQFWAADCPVCEKNFYAPRTEDDPPDFDPLAQERPDRFGDTMGLIVANNKRRCAVIYCDECDETFSTADADDLMMAFISGATKHELDFDSFDNVRWQTEAAKKRWVNRDSGIVESGLTFAQVQAIVTTHFYFELTYDLLESFPAHGRGV